MDQHTQIPPAPLPTGEPWTATTRLLVAALPEGWSLLGRARQGAAAPSVVSTGCHVLAHPGVGVALLDLVPDATPNAEARLRRLLDGVGFGPRFPGNLPAWQGRLEPDRLQFLPPLLEEAFAEQPALSVQGNTAWVAALREALADDPAWEASGTSSGGRAPATPAALPLLDPDPEEEEPARRRFGLRTVLLGLGGASLVFVLGLAAGLLLTPEPPPAPSRSAALAQPAEAPTAPAPQAEPPEPPQAAAPAPETASTAAPPASLGALPAGPEADSAEAAPSQGDGATGDAMPATGAGAGPDPGLVLADPAATPAEAPVAAPQDTPQEVAAVAMPAAEPPAPEAAEAPAEEQPVATSMEASLPLPPSQPLPLPPDAVPAAPPAPPRPAKRAALNYDRRCGEALFRWQKGARLSATEMAYVKEGCVSSAAQRRP